jgi:urease accessory protein
MKAAARLVAAAGPGGATRLTVVRSQPPLVLRRTGQAGPVAEVHLVGGAAGPLAGDQLRLEIEVGSGAQLVMRTAAASVALPGPAEGWSHFHVAARVAPGGALSWLPEPLVAARGCRHRMSAEVEVADGGRVTWREELVWGRHGEDGGDVAAALSVTYDGNPLLVQEIALGPSAPGWQGPAILGTARATGALLLAGPGLVGPPPYATPTCAVSRLAGPGALLSAVAPDALALRRALTSAGEWRAPFVTVRGT